MSDKTDPRRYRCCGHCQPSPNGGCGDMWGEPKDSHEVACPHGCNESLPPGVVRVDTRDEALVERLAEQMLAQQIEKGFIGESTVSGLADQPPAYREAWFREARATLVAVLTAAAGGDQ